MRSHCAVLPYFCTGTLLALALLNPSVAAAQTWAAPRTGPTIGQLVALDATGEAPWPFGSEDVAGDGLSFASAEESVDVRSAYATTDDARLWVRAYLSSTDLVHTSLRLYVFVDADGNRSTGGSAVATEIEAAFTADSSGGGYEHVLGLSGMGTVIGFWDFREAQAAFQPNNPATARARAEVGTDVDPLRQGETVHGYVGGNVELNDLTFTMSCDGAELLFRAVSDVGDDLEVGPRAGCVARDGNGNRIPDQVEEVPRCDADDDCPASGRCIDGTCRYAPACTEATDCESGETCQDDRCVITGGESCSATSECDGLLCDDGSCTRCTEDGLSCAAGEACAPDGRCVPGSAGPAPGSEALVDADERVRGGAFTCATGRASGGASVFALALSWLVLRRRRNQGEQ